MIMETQEALLAKTRIRNATGAAVKLTKRKHRHVAEIGTQGAIAYALLDVANAIRDRNPDPKTLALLRIADALVDAIADGASEETLTKIADAYKLENEGVSFDQKIAPYFPRR